MTWDDVLAELRHPEDLPRALPTEGDLRLCSVTADRLIGIADVAALLGVKRTTVDLWRTRDRRGRVAVEAMPTPVLPRPHDLTRTPFWDRREIEAWAQRTGRKLVI